MKLIQTASISVKILLLILALSFPAVVGIMLRRNFSQIRSVQGFVNGELIFVRASIPGELELKSEKIKLLTRQ